MGDAWDSKQYLLFESERTRPAEDLAARLPLSGVAKAVDIGCGPGNSTAVLRRRYPRAELLGADSSADMLAAARRSYPGVTFVQCDVPGGLAALGGGYDLVFSNACLQWIPEHRTLIPALLSLLRPGGVLAVQMPMNVREPIHRIIARAAASEKWRSRFPQPRVFHPLAPEEYFDLLAREASDFTMWETVYLHRIPSHRAILEWYRGTGLRPYLAALPGELRGPFEEEILREVEKAYPVQANGEILFRFPRFFFTAVR